MKRSNRNNTVLPILILLLMLMVSVTGCTTYLNSIRADLQGIPLWVLQEPAYTIQEVFFTGAGVDADRNPETARQYAIEGILEKVSGFLKYSVTDTYRRELLNDSVIEDLALTLDAEYMEDTEDGSLKVHLLASADRKVISQLVRENLETTRSAEQLIDQPLLSAESAYNARNDITAISRYADAAIQAYISPLEASYEQYQEIMEKIVSVINDFEISAVEEDPSKGSFTFEVKRGTGFFAPKLKDVSFSVEFPVKGSTGLTRISEISITTNSNGRGSFSTDHPGFRGSGTIKLYLNIDEIIEKLENTVGVNDQLLIRVKESAAQTYFEFPFSLVSSIAGEMVAISLLEYDMNGSLLQAHYGLERMIEVFQEDGVQANPIIIDSLNNDLNPGINDSGTISDSGILAQMKEAYEGFINVAVMGSVGVTSTAVNGNDYIATVKGDIKLVFINTGISIDESGTLVANGLGDSREKAMEAALIRFGELAATSAIGILL